MSGTAVPAARAATTNRVPSGDQRTEPTARKGNATLVTLPPETIATVERPSTKASRPSLDQAGPSSSSVPVAVATCCCPDPSGFAVQTVAGEWNESIQAIRVGPHAASPPSMWRLTGGPPAAGTTNSLAGMEKFHSV